LFTRVRIQIYYGEAHPVADSALPVARCSHLILGVGSPGLRQLANAAEQGPRASSSNPLHLYLISHRAVTECGHSRRFCLYPPVQYRIPMTWRDMLYTIMYAAYYVTHPHWWIFSGGSALSSASRDDPLDKQPSGPVNPESDRPQQIPGSFVFATYRYGWLNNPSWAGSCSACRCPQHPVGVLCTAPA
jgi:hypothetical protein